MELQTEASRNLFTKKTSLSNCTLESSVSRTSFPPPNMSEQAPTQPIVRPEEKKLTVAFIQFLRQKVSQREFNEGGLESLEIAVQCLENAFSLGDKDYAFQPGKTLLQLLVDAEGLTGEEEPRAPTAAEIAEANKFKEEGNEFVKANKLNEAIDKYNQAIKLTRDPVYFCNRAAAYCRLEQFDLAIQDCRTALALDDKYAKAYGRMGLAFSCQNNYVEAVEAYRKALELDPNNESYKNNMAIAEEKKTQAEEQFRANPNPFGGLGGLGNLLGGAGGPPDLGSFLNDPNMMQTAMQMMNDPNIQNMMNSMMGSFMGGAAPGGGAPGAEGGAPDAGAGLANFLAAGQNIAQQMQAANPELVEQLRQQFAGANTNDPNHPQNPPNDGNNPPSQ
uniref:SGTA_dimer domain-containing protein n=1 Tax=Panagrellus redivivus TaxID=6233 RepID=A0A7E4UYW8_PANRE